MGRKSAQPDARIAEIAARQHGVVSISQLRTAGLGEAGVLNRHRAGRLHRIHRGVYAVGHRGLSIEARWMAAILAIGDGAAIRHRSAAELWGLLPIAPGPIHVSLAARGGRAKRQGIRLHRQSPDVGDADPAPRDPGHDTGTHHLGPAPIGLLLRLAAAGLTLGLPGLRLSLGASAGDPPGRGARPPDR